MFVAQEVAVRLIHALRPVIELIARRDPDLADQLRRAGSSVLLNIAEGNRRDGKDRPRVFRIAAGSAGEVGAGCQVALAWGYVESKDLVEVLPIVDRQLALLWGLTRGRRRA